VKALHELYQSPLDGGAKCDYFNISVCDHSEDFNEFTLAIYSPASHSFNTFIRVPVNVSEYAVRDATGKDLLYDLVPGRVENM